MIEPAFRKKVEDFVASHKDDIIKNIIELVSIKSVQEAPLPDAPYGEGPKKALVRALALAEELGLDTHNCENHLGYAYIQGESDKYLASIGHLDVVPEGNGWKGDPFTVRIVEDWLIGRGVADNKGACVLSLYMLKFFKENYPTLPYSLRAILGCNEETGMEDAKYYVKTQPAPEFVFTPDGAFPVCVGEKGIASFNLISNEIKNTNIVSVKAGVASNVVPDKAELVIKTDKTLQSKENFEIVKEGENTKITATGIGGHAASPKNTVNAIGLLVDFCLENDLFTQDEKPYMLLLQKLHSATDGSGVGIDSDDGLFDPLTCVGGILTFEDGKYSQNINIRYPTSTTYEEMHEILKGLFVPIGGDVPGTRATPPFYIDPKTPIIQALLSSYNEITNQETEPYVIGGGTYAKIFPLAAAFGIGDRSIKKPDFIGSAHGAEEGFSIDGFMRALEILIISTDKLLKLEY